MLKKISKKELEFQIKNSKEAIEWITQYQDIDYLKRTYAGLTEDEAQTKFIADIWENYGKLTTAEEYFSKIMKEVNEKMTEEYPEAPNKNHRKFINIFEYLKKIE